MKTKGLTEIQLIAILSLDRDDQMRVLRHLCSAMSLIRAAQKYAKETPEEQLRRYAAAAAATVQQKK